MSKAIESRQKIFVNAGLTTGLFDRYCAEAQAAIISVEAKQGVTWTTADFEPKRLKEIYEVAKSVWVDNAVTPSQLPQDQIPFAELYSLPGYLVALYECWFNWTIKSTAQAIKFLKLHPELQRPTAFIADGVGLAGMMYAHAFPHTNVTSDRKSTRLNSSH